MVPLRDGGTVFRYRVGKGNVTTPGVEAAILDIPVSSMPFDSQVHELIWDVTLATGTIRLWCDGVLLGGVSASAPARICFRFYEVLKPDPDVTTSNSGKFCAMSPKIPDDCLQIQWRTSSASCKLCEFLLVTRQ